MTGLLAGAAMAASGTAMRGDPKHGKAITAGPPAIEAEHACSACHGDNGEGKADGGVPRLAAQSQDYLLRALAEYASGVRQSEVMTPIAKELKDQQRDDVTAYYASFHKQEWTRPKAVKEDVLRHGEVLATVGSEKLGVQACQNCHGPEGRGLPPTAPYLAGQSADYLTDRLKAWKQGPRTDDPTPPSIMAHIAQQLGEDDIAALAQYFAQLRPDPIRLGSNAQEQQQ